MYFLKKTNYFLCCQFSGTLSLDISARSKVYFLKKANYFFLCCQFLGTLQDTLPRGKTSLRKWMWTEYKTKRCECSTSLSKCELDRVGCIVEKKNLVYWPRSHLHNQDSDLTAHVQGFHDNPTQKMATDKKPWKADRCCSLPTKLLVLQTLRLSHMKEVPFVVERRKWCVHKDWRRVETTIVLRAGRRSTERSTKVGVVKLQNKTHHVIVMGCGGNVGEVPLRVQSKSHRNSPWQSARAWIASRMQLRKPPIDSRVE